MIGKADLIALSLGVHHKVIVQIEQEGALVAIVDFAAAVRLVLTYDLATVLGDELVGVHFVLDKDAPARYFGGRPQQMLFQASLNGHIRAGVGRRRLRLKIARTTRLTQVRVALAHSQKTRTMLGVTLGAALAAVEAILASLVTAAVFLAEVATLDTFALLVARLTWMIARIVVTAQTHVVLVDAATFRFVGVFFARFGLAVGLGVGRLGVVERVCIGGLFVHFTRQKVRRRGSMFGGHREILLLLFASAYVACAATVCGVCVGGSCGRLRIGRRIMRGVRGGAVQVLASLLPLGVLGNDVQMFGVVRFDVFLHLDACLRE